MAAYRRVCYCDCPALTSLLPAAVASRGRLPFPRRTQTLNRGHLTRSLPSSDAGPQRQMDDSRTIPNDEEYGGGKCF
jgi:hypothetical protein